MINTMLRTGSREKKQLKKEERKEKMLKILKNMTILDINRAIKHDIIPSGASKKALEYILRVLTKIKEEKTEYYRKLIKEEEKKGTEKRSTN
jgi:hypothetical protein